MDKCWEGKVAFSWSLSAPMFPLILAIMIYEFLKLVKHKQNLLRNKGLKGFSIGIIGSGMANKCRKGLSKKSLKVEN